MMLYVTMYLTFKKLEQGFEPCPSDTLYTVDYMSPCSGILSKHKKLFSEGPKEEA